MKSIKFKDLDKLNEILNKYSKEERIDLLNSINLVMEDSYNYLRSKDWLITTVGGNPIYNLHCVDIDKYTKLGLSREELKKPLDGVHFLDELIQDSDGEWDSNYDRDTSLDLFGENLLELLMDIEKQKGLQIVKIGHTELPCNSNDEGEPILEGDSTKGLSLQLSDGSYWYLGTLEGDL